MDELTALYRRLARQAHPDTGPAAERGIRHILMQQINVAYAAKDLVLLQRLATEVDAFSPDQAPSQQKETRTSATPRPNTKPQQSTTDQRSQRRQDDSSPVFRTKAEQRRLEQEARDATEAYNRAYNALLNGALTIDGRNAGFVVDQLQSAYIIASWRCARTPDEIKKWEAEADLWQVKLPNKPMSEQEMKRRINLSDDELDPYAREARKVEGKFRDYLTDFFHAHPNEFFGRLPEDRNFMSNRYREYLRLRLRGDL